MSWIEQLSKTYDACFGQPQFLNAPLSPIDHVEQQAHMEISLDENGVFLRACIVEKESTLIPATEKSAGRTSGPVAHPLCDKLRYIAKDYGSEDYQLYLKQLQAWEAQSRNPALTAILRYVERGDVVKDLTASGILTIRSDGSLENEWKQGLSPLARLLSADPKTKRRDQGNAFIRWRVEIPGMLESAVWKDTQLQKDWAIFNAALPANVGLCLGSGESMPLADSHPKRLRHGGDGAKLISSNDNSGFTFRGRFQNASEAYGLGSATTQKVHNALRWLIARQGTRLNKSSVLVAWEVQGALAFPILDDSWQFFHSLDDSTPESEQKTGREPAEDFYQGDAGQHFALRLKKAVQGYKQKIDDNADIVVMGLDSATPGRMAILFYRELKSFEFLARLQDWHESLAWPQNMGKSRHFVGAPAPRDIAEAAYGQRIDDKLRKATLERLLPCIVDGRTVPRDLVQAVVARTTNRAGLDAWEFERNLGIACSLFRASHRKKEKYTMSLDESRTTRDYLYGRLLAIADNLEEMALRIARQDRDTNAARLMQRFADHPYTTWLTLYAKQLRPYIAQLHSTRGGPLYLRQKLIDTIVDSFEIRDGQSTFLDNRPLTGEFLLGYHSQREALRTHPQTNNTSETTEGDAE